MNVDFFDDILPGEEIEFDVRFSSVHTLKGDPGKDGNVMFATFGIDPVTGRLTMRTPDAYDGPRFILTKNGHLEVSING